MDESWRCTMGAAVPRQRSPVGGSGGQQMSLAADDFRDVFGGPPRTVLLSSFYGEPADHAAAGSYCYPSYYGGGGDRRPYADGRGGGRMASSAAVPTEEGFFDDIFGARARHVRSRSSRSKSTKSSSVVSSDDFGSGCRARPDAALSSFASKLRPIEIPSRRYDSSPPSTASTRGDQYYQSQSSFTCSTAAYPACRYYYGGDSKSKASGSSRASAASSSGAAAERSAAGRNHHQQRASSGFCCFTSNPGETSSHEPSFRRTTNRGAGARSMADTGADDDYGYCYSPSSATSSSLFGNPLSRTTPRRRLEEEAAMMMMEVRERAPLLMDDDDIDSVGAAAVDEAIAWAKERFWSHDQ